MSNEHDDLCPVAKIGVGSCECRRIEEIREDERRLMATVDGMSAYDVAEAAYARGRLDAAEAINGYSVSFLPAFYTDTPLAVAVRVKDVCAGLAVGRKPEPPAPTLTIP